MPDSVDQYYTLSIRDRAMIMWLLVDRLFDVSEEEREALLPNVDWENAGQLQHMYYVCMCVYTFWSERGRRRERDALLPSIHFKELDTHTH
jgi:hypothetical protein